MNKHLNRASDVEVVVVVPQVQSELDYSGKRLHYDQPLDNMLQITARLYFFLVK